MIAFASSLDQAGPVRARRHRQRAALRHMVGQDPCDSTSLAYPEEIRCPSAERLDGIRLGVPRT
jgi:aspartyl-tRNA(Asn)/glutamyl-tRNA(Gln) amidotransferase subunit A